MPIIKRYVYILCLTILSSSCSQPDDQAIRFGLESAPITLDPRFATDAVSYRITRLLYRSLVDFNESFEFIPDLANWQVLNAEHYRFTLQHAGRQFHSGEWLTAYDVKATYDFILDPNHASPHRGSLKIIQEVVVVDENTVDFILEKPDPLFPAKLVIGIMPASLIEADHAFNQHPVGSGPAAFHQWFGEGDLSLKRQNDDQLLRFVTVKDPTVRILKILKGDLDIIQGDIPREMIGWLKDKDGISFEKKQGTTFTYIGMNLADQITGQLAIRQAIAYAINRDDIIQYVMRDTGHKAGNILPSTHWGNHPELSGVQFDPDRSRYLLKLAGYSEDNPLKITYKTSNNPFRIRLAAVIQQQLQQVGIKVDVRSYDWGVFYSDIKSGRFQMYSLSWVGLKTPDIFRYAFHSTSLPPEGANRGRFIDAQADRMIETAELKEDLAEQAEWYRDLQAYLQERLPYIPLWYEDNILLTSENISGYTLSADGNYDGLLKVTKH